MNPHEADPARLTELSAAKRALLERLAKGGVIRAQEPLPLTQGDGPFPLSFAQESIWFLDRLAGQIPMFNVLIAGWLPREVSITELERALAEATARHDALRTGIRASGGEPVAFLLSSVPVHIGVTEATAPSGQRAEAAREAALAIAAKPFTLDQPPLWRAELVRFPGAERLFVLAAHHIVADATSISLLVTELTGLVPATDPPARYVDFAIWQRHQVSSGALAADLDHWRRTLQDPPPALRLPADFPAPPSRSLAGATLTADLDDQLTDRLRGLCRQERVTLYVAMLSAFAVLLRQYTGETDILIGSTVAGREGRPEFQRLIGMFTNMVALRLQVEGTSTFRELLAKTARCAATALAHQAVPFDLLVRALGHRGDRTRPPLVQVGFNMPLQEMPVDFGLTDVPMIPRGSQLDLTLHLVTGRSDALELQLEYSTGLFRAETIRRMADQLITILDAATRDPGSLVDGIGREYGAEPGEGLTGERASAAEPLHRCFERQARLTPDATAVMADGVRIGYRELDDRASALAGRLQAMGVGPETPVGVFQRRGAHLVESLLAIWKAGGAYVPLDPDQPPARSRAIVTETGIRVVLAHPSAGDPRTLGDVALLDAGAPDSGPCEMKAVEVTGDNAAYVIYTSGSTGRPKGVVITHDGIANRVQWAVRTLGLTDTDRVLLKTALTFDAAGWEIFAPLVAGGTVVLAPPDAGHDPEQILQAVAKHDVTVLQAVPSVLRLLAVSAGWSECRSLRFLFSAGEPLTAELCSELAGHADLTIYNTYGPTECSIDATAYQYRREQVAGPVPIGQPITNTRVLILDPAGQLVPAGMAGELYIGGAGVARGYAGQPGLTADRFVPDPIGPPGARIYRTGDLARRRTAGHLEFIGRRDAQVKVNGVRIEPAEVEAALTAHQAVRAATVAAVGDAGERRLAGYVVADRPDIDLAELRIFLLSRLPAAMVPTVFAVLDSLPLTPSGKVNRTALPAIEPEETAKEASYVGPGAHTEQAVASIWAELLHRERIGLRSDFFTLGGHSLLFARLAARLRDEFGINVELASLYSATTVEAQARLMAEQLAADAPAIEALPRDQPLPLSSGQDRMWFLHQLDPGGTEFVVPAFLPFTAPVDIYALESALADLVAQHEVLRTRYVVRNGAPVQVVDLPFRVPVGRLAIPPGCQIRRAAELVADELAQPFDLQRGPVLRCLLTEAADNRQIVILAVHHIACDGWSMQLLAGDLRAAYAARSAGRPYARPPGQLQYADYASWQKRQLSMPGMRTDLEYWCARLDGIQPLALATDHPRPIQWSGRGRTLAFTVPADITASVIRCGRKHSATPFMTLLAAYQMLLARRTATTDIVVGTPVAGRSHPDTSQIVGFFVNNLVLRTDLSGDPSFTEVIARTRQTALAAYARQDVPYELLVERLVTERDQSRPPLFQTMFAYGNEAMPSGLAGLVAGTPQIPWPTSSFEVTMSLADGEDGTLHGLVEYATDLFEAATIERLISDYVHLLESVAAHQDLPVSCVGITIGRERQPPVQILPEAFAAQVARTPEAAAITQAGWTLTYAELDAWTDRLAARLRREGVTQETLVAVCLNRSPELVASMLAVMRAGGVYVPVDPESPQPHREAILTDAGIKIVVTADEGVRQFRAHGRRVIPATQYSGSDLRHPARPNVVDAENLAYVIHTSGSTGRPKGVMVTHAALLSHLRGIVTAYDIQPDDTMVMLCSPVFDLAVEQIGSALIAGARLVLADQDLWSPADLPGHIARHQITKLDVTPAYMRELLGSIGHSDSRVQSLNLLNIGADVVLHKDIQRLLAVELPARVVCTYGPTEATVTATLLEISPAETAECPPHSVVPIGQPMHDTDAYVLGEALEPLDDYVAGELYLAGPRLARGYLGRPDLTAERFVPDPFAAEHGARMYRTGDRVLRRADGVLEFLGRVDGQIKIRGFRVELGEIEAVLAVHPQVREACVVARSSGAERHLEAHIAASPAGQEPTAPALATYLRERLPEYMIPDRWAVHPELPHTVSGKVDRKALPETGEVVHAEPDGRDAAEDPVEARIAGIWLAVLGVDRVGRHDDFFHLGGNSLLAARAHARLNEDFGIEVPLRQLFDFPTVAGLGAVVRQVIEREVDGLSDDQVTELLR